MCLSLPFRRPPFHRCALSLFVFAAAFALCSGCASRKRDVAQAQVVPESQAEMGWEENGETVYLDMGDILAVVLPSNPSTGYSWAVTRFDANVVAPVGEPEYIPDPNPQGFVGGGGKSLFLFEGMGVGTTGLDLFYHRVWETGRPPMRIYSIRVVVREKEKR